MTSPVYRLRWRFDFLDGTKKIGMWSTTSKNPVDQAWNKNKEGLLRASIEAKTMEGIITTLVEVDGHDFCLFKWLVFAMGPALVKGSVTPIHSLGGLQIVTRENNIYALHNGRVWAEPRTDEDKKFHYATFGR